MVLWCYSKWFAVFIMYRSIDQWLNLSCEQRALHKLQMVSNKHLVKFPLHGTFLIFKKEMFMPSNLSWEAGWHRSTKLFWAWASQHSSHVCEQFEQRTNFKLSWMEPFDSSMHWWFIWIATPKMGDQSSCSGYSSLKTSTVINFHKKKEESKFCTKFKWFAAVLTL